MLNQSYEPLMVCNVKRAIILMFLDKAEIVEKNSGWVHGVHANYPVPSVIRLAKQARVAKRKIQLNRKNIMLRDNMTCQYCNRNGVPLTIDHVIPKQYGGKDTWENLVAACHLCNNLKANHTPEQAGMPLLKRPKQPPYFFFLQQMVNDDTTAWKQYLFIRE